MEILIVDSSIIVCALRKEEQYHKKSKALLKDVLDGKYIVLTPYTVLVEVVAAIKRRTGSDALAGEVKNNLLRFDNMHFLDLIKSRATEAADIAKKLGVRGMDAIVIQAAKETKAELVSLDAEMVEKAKSLVKTKSI